MHIVDLVPHHKHSHRSLSCTSAASDTHRDSQKQHSAWNSIHHGISSSSSSSSSSTTSSIRSSRYCSVPFEIKRVCRVSGDCVCSSSTTTTPDSFASSACVRATFCFGGDINIRDEIIRCSTPSTPPCPSTSSSSTSSLSS